jgi:formylglycine-generating enzyme required for sulfatase activity
MHVETLAYMLHQLPLDTKVRQTDPPIPVTPPVDHRMIEIPAGTATLGLSRSLEIFGWDNEFETHPVDVPAFEIDQYMVTNQQWLDFMNAGGYEARDFWSDDDWNWKTAYNISHPVFWKDSPNGWLCRTMFDEVRLPEGRSAFGVEGLLGNGWEWTSTPFSPFPGFQPFPFYRGYSADFFDNKHFVMKGGSPRTATCMLRPTFRNWFQAHYQYVYAGFRCVNS